MQTPGSQSRRILPSHASTTSTSSAHDQLYAAEPAYRPRVRATTSTRSRTGCWTCRDRKVKCDEGRPRCGPCTRLDRICDWHHRWKFEPVTESTQDKFNNVNLAGNVVWDPEAARAAALHTAQTAAWPDPRRDSLPAFGELISDEDREKKAEAYFPGTFQIITNQGSFSHLPEYGGAGDARRVSLYSRRESIESQSTQLTATPHIVSDEDPNIVFVSQFQDPSATGPSNDPSQAGQDRRSSLRTDLRHLAIASSASPERPMYASAADHAHATVSSAGSHHFSAIDMRETDEELLRDYERVVAPRLLHIFLNPHMPDQPDQIVTTAGTFAPLLHAICAIILLVRADRNQGRIEDALHREAMATQMLQAEVLAGIDPNSDIVFYVHFFMLIYDICSLDIQHNMTWAQHMRLLKRMAVNQDNSAQLDRDLESQMLSFAMTIDIQAALAGHHSNSLAKALATDELNSMHIYLMPLDGPSRLHPQEAHMAHNLATFATDHQKLSASLSQLALDIRAEYSDMARMNSYNVGVGIRSQGRLSAEVSAIISGREQRIGAFQGEMWATWSRRYPPYLPREDPRAGMVLSPRLRILFESGFLFHSINVIYSNICMYPHQCLSNATSTGIVTVQCRHIVTLVHGVLSDGLYARPPMGFALFLAGVASPEVEVKQRCISYMKDLQNMAIGRNAARASKLLEEICEAQRMAIIEGQLAEDVDWLEISRKAGLDVIDFGV